MSAETILHGVRGVMDVWALLCYLRIRTPGLSARESREPATSRDLKSYARSLDKALRRPALTAGSRTRRPSLLESIIHLLILSRQIQMNRYRFSYAKQLVRSCLPRSLIHAKVMRSNLRRG